VTIVMDLLNLVGMLVILALEASPLLILILIQRWLLKKEKNWLRYLLPIIFSGLALLMTFVFSIGFANKPTISTWSFLITVVMYLVLFNIPTLALMGTNLVIQRKNRVRREMTEINVKDLA